jgi:tellurite resistance protein TerC
MIWVWTAFIVFVLLMLGLRSLYFALAGMVERFRYLRISLAIVLLVVGVKMLLAGTLKQALGRHFNLYLLAVILAVLAAGVAASLMGDRRRTART